MSNNFTKEKKHIQWLKIHLWTLFFYILSRIVKHNNPQNKGTETKATCISDKSKWKTDNGVWKRKIWILDPGGGAHKLHI